jgi:hypothetical protein
MGNCPPSYLTALMHEVWWALNSKSCKNIAAMAALGQSSNSAQTGQPSLAGVSAKKSPRKVRAES